MFSLYRSCDNTLVICFFQISSYSCSLVHLNYEKILGENSPETFIGRQNIQDTEVKLQSLDIKTLICEELNFPHCVLETSLKLISCRPVSSLRYGKGNLACNKCTKLLLFFCVLTISILIRLDLFLPKHSLYFSVDSFC